MTAENVSEEDGYTLEDKPMPTGVRVLQAEFALQILEQVGIQPGMVAVMSNGMVFFKKAAEIPQPAFLPQDVQSVFAKRTEGARRTYGSIFKSVPDTSAHPPIRNNYVRRSGNTPCGCGCGQKLKNCPKRQG